MALYFMKPKTLKIDAQSFYTLAKQNLTNGHSIQFQAHGNSMYPTIKNGNIITVAPIFKKHLKPGNIILHRAGKLDQLVAHRIISITNTENHKIINTCGDTIGCFPEAISETDILGVVTHVEHNGRKIPINSIQNLIKSKLWVTGNKLKIKAKRIKKLFNPQ